MVGNDSSPYLKVFVEVSKPLSAEIGDILISRPKFRNCARIIQYNYYRKISIFAIFANYHYPVSYNVVKAYKVRDFRPNFSKCLDNNVIRQNRERQTCSLHALHGMELLRDGNGN